MGWPRRKKKKEPKSVIESERGAKLLEDLIECCDGKSNPIKFFSADEICKATDNFNSSNLLFTGFDQKWYSGKNENHPKMLIKNLDFDTGELYCRDIAVSSMVSGQKNFLKLVGCCLEFENPIMVFDGVKKHYKLDLREQPWKRRMKIAEDITTALAYLHTAFPRPFIYRTLSFDDILLDKEGVAKLRNFSYCVSIPEGETFVDVRVVGHFLYMDPKYAMRGVVSEKTDVFAIGRFMQNLLVGNKRFVKFISNYGDVTMKEPRMEETADPEMLEKMGEISEQELCQVKAFLTLSQRCIVFEVDHKEFPTMVEVAKELKKIVRSFRKDHSSSPLGKTETQFDSTQDISSSVVL